MALSFPRDGARWLAPSTAIPISVPPVCDAPATVLGDEAVQSGSLSDLLSVDLWGYPLDAEHGARSYRPLVSLTHAVEARLLVVPASLEIRPDPRAEASLEQALAAAVNAE